MKAVRIILGVLLSLLIAGAVMVGQCANVFDEGIKTKNINLVFNERPIRNIVCISESGTAAYNKLTADLKGVAEGIDDTTVEQILNTESFVNLYKDCATQLIKYFRKNTESMQSEDEIQALVSNAVDNLSIENLQLDADQKTAMKDVVLENVTEYLKGVYQKADEYRNFNFFGLDQFTVFGNIRLLALMVGIVALILLIVDCWSFGRALIISAVMMIVASIPFVLVGLGKQGLIASKATGFIGLILSLYSTRSLPVMLWALVVIAVGFIFLIIGVSARLSGVSEDDE